MDAFDKTSWFPKAPEVGFGTGSRPPMHSGGGGPGPGAYPIKTTMAKLHESHIQSPCQYTLRSRTKFGDPNEKSMSKSSANEPGPAQYDLQGKFLSGKNPRKSAFPKGGLMKDKAAQGPGPGSYQPIQSMGKQVISTKAGAVQPVFSKAARPSMVIDGASDVGPGEYNPPPAACDNQVDSRKRTCATLKFGEGYKTGGSSSKFDFSEPSPGPGSYVLPGGVATLAKGSPFRNSPAVSLSGRNKFGSPW
eukprot:CAMPEP_0174973782 /NCGR_PEP_ID=MMETSP0004_2-20121128/11438_1 /TAXON_ID=420556 /ORGANISM="Ochromonas sp., Strain CCMP1393" /LENGTH=247 /DNA_ID=CAMNT_0016224279 /DNA_START=119 /DNA_END=862 /DNA_ORIENTATION=+